MFAREYVVVAKFWILVVVMMVDEKAYVGGVGCGERGEGKRHWGQK